MHHRDLITLAGALALCAPHAGAGHFAQTAYEHVFEFNDTLGTAPMGLAWDGALYHVVTGGSRDGVRYARHDSNGDVVSTFTPNFDFRSITVSPAGDIFARAAGSQALQGQQAPGVFALEFNVSGAFLEPDVQLILSPDGSTLHSLMFGAVFHYDATTGTNTGFTALDGFGDLNNEGDTPQFQRLAITDDGTFLTYSNGVLSAWDDQGDRLGTTTLIDAGVSSASHTSLSYANGLVFVIEEDGGLWRGFDLTVPSPAALTSIAPVAMLTSRRRR